MLTIISLRRWLSRIELLSENRVNEILVIYLGSKFFSKVMVLNSFALLKNL